MKNLLTVAQNLFLKPQPGNKTGTIISKNSAGGFVVQSVAGGQEIIFGSARVGDTVQYQGRKILCRVKQETTTVYGIK